MSELTTGATDFQIDAALERRLRDGATLRHNKVRAIAQGGSNDAV